MTNITELPEWQHLNHHHKEISHHAMRDWFLEDQDRFKRFSLQSGEILLDFSRNRITENSIAKLCALANAIDLPEKINALFSGQPINATEKRPALHTALRDLTRQPILVNGKNITDTITATQQKLNNFVTNIHNKKIKGATGKPFTDIVNVGIGGSNLGPMMCTRALAEFAVSDLRFHFISTVDKTGLNEVLEQVNPETTLFIISSKTFSTIETLTNAETISSWIQSHLGQKALAHHFVAVTQATDKAKAFGVSEENIFSIWEWIGGRYSVWSAIGLPLMLMIGVDHFNDFLAGAHEMDQHFKTAPLNKNMPVLLALLGIWYMNFFGSSVQAVVPYSDRLRLLVPYLQQAEMESSGKSRRLNGEEITYSTGPVIFGEEGCNGQHAYHQLLLQGRHLIPVDFILIAKMHEKANDHHHDIVIASGLSQARALMRGKTYDEAKAELLSANHNEEEASELAYHRVIPGNRPSNVLVLNELTPKTLGNLLALYEHKIFVQGVIWGINPFDQFGVELGKQLLPDILKQVQGGKVDSTDIDSATLGMINHFKKIQGRA